MGLTKEQDEIQRIYALVNAYIQGSLSFTKGQVETISKSIMDGSWTIEEIIVTPKQFNEIFEKVRQETIQRIKINAHEEASKVGLDKEYLNEVLEKIIAEYLVEHKKHEEALISTIERFIKSERKPLPPAETPLFQKDNKTELPVTPPILSSFQALIKHGDWEADEEGQYVYRHNFSRGNVIEHYISDYDPEREYLKILKEEAAKKIIEQFGVNVAMLHLVLASHAIKQPKPWESTFHLKGSDLIKTLGLDKTKKKTKSEKLNEVIRRAEVLSGLSVMIHWNQGKVGFRVDPTSMWNISILRIGQYDMDGNVPNPSEVFLTIRCGLWAQYFMNKQSKEFGQGFYNFGYLAQETLRINSYHNELAAKLAIHLTIMTRMRSEFSVRNLLEKLESKEYIQLAMEDYKKRYDLLEKWDNALMLLHENKWKIIFDDETYPDEIRPKGFKNNPEDKRPQNTFKLLMDDNKGAMITIYPPDHNPQLIAEKKDKTPAKKRNKKKSLPTPSRLSGHEVRKAREEMGWSQQYLADALGKSKQWVSHIEHERRSIGHDDQETLRKLLNII